MNLFRVSVIIPVYNAAKYLRRAVESAVKLEEVGEVLLIEDCSPDNALELCIQLEKEYGKIKLLRHPNGENRGAGASRNLGIENSSYSYIAFLDADDYYLSNRFIEDKIVFSQTKADGVYSAALNISSNDSNYKRIHTVRKSIKPHKLFYYLIRGTYGHFHTNSITLKKELLEKVGMFNTDLRLHQDTELWLRCAITGRLQAGSIHKPTSVILTHGQNRITSWSKKTILKYLLSLMSFYKMSDVGVINYLLIVKKAFKNVTYKTELITIIRSIKIL